MAKSLVINPSKGEGLVFRKGEIVRKVAETELVDELFKEIKAILEEEK